MSSIRTLQISHPFPSTLTSQTKSHKPNSITSLSFTPPQATESNQTDTADADADAEPQPSSPADSSFDSRLSQIRLKYRSGTGKKAEQRRARSKKSSSSSGKGTGSGGGLMLPPVALKEPVTAGGVKVEVGFTPYSERLNGAVAALGLAALLLVELGSGKGLLKYHAGPTIMIQVYTVAAATALFVKYEREKISVWPEKPTPENETTATTASE